MFERGVDVRGVVSNRGLRGDGCRQLPMWMHGSLVTSPAFGEAYGRLVRFFKRMNGA